MLKVIFLLFLFFTFLEQPFYKTFLPSACHWSVILWPLWFVKVIGNVIWHHAEILESLFVLISSFDYARALWVMHAWRLPASLSFWILAPFMFRVRALRYLGGASQTILEIFWIWVHFIMKLLNFGDCWCHITRILFWGNRHLNSTFIDITYL